MFSLQYLARDGTLPIITILSLSSISIYRVAICKSPFDSPIRPLECNYLQQGHGEPDCAEGDTRDPCSAILGGVALNYICRLALEAQRMGKGPTHSPEYLVAVGAS